MHYEKNQEHNERILNYIRTALQNAQIPYIQY